MGDFSLLQGSDHQFILTEFDVEHDVALSVYAKYYKQVIDHWICVYVRYGQAPFHDPYLDTWEYDFLEVLPRKLTRSGWKLIVILLLWKKQLKKMRLNS